MWTIGNYKINSPVMLAPMAGITSYGYRHFMSNFGVAISVTEMVSDMGLIYGNKETKEYVSFPKEKMFTGVQLFGHDPECLKEAAKIALSLNPNIDFFDVNMGCPVPKVTKTGAGSSLLKNPKLCGDIIRAIKEVTSLPVTAKIRLGFDDSHINYLEVIEELEGAGCDMIAIHTRTAKQLYSGKARTEIIKDLQEKMHVPLVISGDINSLDDAIVAIEITKAKAVMVARGGIGNPFLIKQIIHYYETGERLPNPSLNEQLEYMLQLADDLINEKGEAKAMRIYRGIANKFLTGFPNMKQYKNRLSIELTDRESLVRIINEIKADFNLN